MKTKFVIKNFFDYTVLMWSLFIFFVFLGVGSILIYLFNWSPETVFGQILFWLITFDMPVFLFMFFKKNMSIKRRKKALIVLQLIFISITSLPAFGGQDQYSLILYFIGFHIVMDQLINYDVFQKVPIDRAE